MLGKSCEVRYWTKIAKLETNKPKKHELANSMVMINDQVHSLQPFTPQETYDGFLHGAENMPRPLCRFEQDAVLNTSQDHKL